VLLRSASDLAALRRNSGTIRMAAERAAKIVFALKSYAHPGSAGGEPIEASLAENVETVLTLYQNQIKHGVELVRSFEDAGIVRGHHEELNQVWTNLVHNALQAMHYRGRLELRVAREGSHVVVQVFDSGSGIPEDALHRIFEPFFTTKGQGEGSGLGLSICKDIVERHAGTLRVESRPGRTVFTVVLPAP
jgi:two-component system, NtrC family, sensor kinase